MELMWLVYAVENLTYNGEFFWEFVGFIAFVMVVLGVISFIVAVTETDIETEVDRWKNYFPTKTVIWVVAVSMCLHVLLPTRQTAIYMAGAYMVQKVVTHEKTKVLGDKTYNAAIKQLDKWAEEVPELKAIAEEVLEEKK